MKQALEDLIDEWVEIREIAWEAYMNLAQSAVRPEEVEVFRQYYEDVDDFVQEATLLYHDTYGWDND